MRRGLDLDASRGKIKVPDRGNCQHHRSPERDRAIEPQKPMHSRLLALTLLGCGGEEDWMRGSAFGANFLVMAGECGPPSWVLYDLKEPPRLRVNPFKSYRTQLGGPHSPAMTRKFAPKARL